ncbi:hypothetical protein HDU98_005830 [Podochytrium sp. JEL0797]|nr:hypothetical protein HDU98_005830 [Podochytrium sp. JEL0797]
MQLIGKSFAKVHRAIWTLIGAVIYVTLAIISINKFNSVLENFLLVIAYFLAPYVAIHGAEFIVFRGRDFKQYPVDIWESPRELPLGAAAIVALGIGFAGAVLGMAEVWYTGVVALKISQPFGGDVGFEMAFGFALVAYLILRTLEKSQMGR